MVINPCTHYKVGWPWTIKGVLTLWREVVNRCRQFCSISGIEARPAIVTCLLSQKLVAKDTLRQTNIAMENGSLKMYFLLNMLIFHCYVSLPRVYMIICNENTPYISCIFSGRWAWPRPRYQLLQQRLRGFVSVGHRPSLQDFHSHVLWLQRIGSKMDPIDILFLNMDKFRSLQNNSIEIYQNKYQYIYIIIILY